ncbi:SAM-dependent methyltransferase [Antribacter gilvus]|uniref:SAM-dependent methyltransferase n=1 Tax=Antribacter gilvus TaxID=2304675 RepID=UPI000F78F29A|nr:methyltransferase domain-containing protein [Antribacter gilvus]
MTDDQPPNAGAGSLLLLNSPLRQASLDRLIARAAEHQPTRIVDHGCGWGEVLLQALAACPGATGLGIEVHDPDVQRARATATERGLTGRVRFESGSSTDHREPADLLISLGAFQAFGDLPTAVRELRADLLPGGRALFGMEYWTSAPAPAELAHMWPGASESDCLSLPDLVDQLHEAGWRILDLHESTRTEFDDFELGHLREREQWLIDHPDHPVRAELDSAWTAWLRGHRRTMGFVTFVLG